MSSLYLSLVDQLATRHDAGRRHNAALDAEEQASRLFLIACDLIGAFKAGDLCDHVEQMVTQTWPEVLRHAETAQRSKGTPVLSSSVGAASASVPTLIAASGALVGYLWSQMFSKGNSADAEHISATAHSAWVRKVHDQWQSCVLQLLAAQPPFSAEACTAACYTVGQLSLLPEGCCDRVLRAACEALQAGCEDGLTAVLATELLGQCTSLMVVCRPFQLHGAMLTDPAVQHRQRAQENDRGKKGKAGNPAGKRARPSTQRTGCAAAVAATTVAASGERKNSHTVESPSAPNAANATAADATVEETDEACAAIPSCYPFPTAQRVGHIKTELIECCLATLGAASMSANTATSQQRQQQHRTVPTALLCQRVLIPLLLLDGSEGLQRYEELIHTLLHTLATRTDAPAFGREGAAPPVAASQGDAAPSACGVALCDSAADGALLPSHNCDDVVLLIAALFDFLFRQPSLNPATDFRFSPFLWGVLSGAMHRSLTASEMDAGHRANMQLRVEYLLKRIVYLTKEQQYAQTAQGQLPPVVAFHPLFCWCSAPAAGSSDAVSAVAWDNFFLVLESLNEYGWHIIEPVMPRLDALVADLNTYLGACATEEGSAGGAARPSPHGALHPQWIEMLLLKLILHPNVGVRKVGLRRVWGLPTRVLQSLSATFLFQYTFQSASDPRLCADLDRIPITASFLDTKAFEGTEVKAVPDVEPLAQEVERFYSTVFLTRWAVNDATAVSSTAVCAPTANTAAASVTDDVATTRGRIDAVRRLLDTTLNKPPRFTVCVLARTLLAIGQVLLAHHIDAEPILLDDGVLQRLHRFMRDSVQENIPFWLDVRVTAILFAALTTFAAATPSPRRCRANSSFWRLYCMCGPLGESGGHSITGMDACGQYGLVGAALEERFLQVWLAQLSAQMQETCSAELTKMSEGVSAAPSLVEALLDVAGLEDRVQQLLHASASASTVNVVEIKETFFLVGTLARTNSPRDAQLLRQVAHTIAATVASLQTRAYCTPAHLLTSAACLVEFHHTMGSEACAQLWPLHTTLQSLSAALHTHALSSLSAALQTLSQDSTTSSCRFQSRGCGETAAEDGVWMLMNTTHFDILAAAIASVNAIACCTSGQGMGSAVSTEAGEALGASERVPQLMTLVEEAAAAYETLTGAAKQKTTAATTSGHDTNGSVEDDGEARVSAVLVVTRNAYRLLQSELCGFLALQQNVTAAGTANSNNGVNTSGTTAATADADAGAGAAPLPTDRESLSSAAAASTRCPLGLRLPAHAVQAYLQSLMRLPAYRVPTGAVPSALSDMAWSTLLGQHGRYRCNVLYVLALCLCPASQGGSSGTPASDPIYTTPQADYEALVAAVQDFALAQLEECWTMNLASVYDLLVWVASAGVPHVVDYLAIADGMWDHMKEVGARQFTRLAALAFTVLHFVMPHHPTYVRDLLLRVLEGEGKEAQTADRDVYFAAMTASLQVLHDPAQNWPVLREVLLYAAVLFNTNRDEEENESTVAVTEPLLWSWPAALRLYYPPTTRMSAVGRAMAVATLLWSCQADVANRAVPLVMELLRMNTCHPVVTHEPCMPNSRTHRTRIRLWQLLCALLPCLAQPQQPVPLAQVEEIFRLLTFHCVTVNNMGSVRRLMELFAIRLVEQHPKLYTVVSEALGNYTLRPQVCGSYILIACHALLRQEDRYELRRQTDSANVASGTTAAAEVHDDDGTYESLFPRILQQSTSNQHLLRIISHIGLVNLCQRRVAHGRPLSPAVQAIYDYVLQAPEHIKFREKHADMLFFNTDEASSPRNLFCVQRKEANTVLAEVLPAAAFERVRFIETELCCMIGAMYPMELLRVHDWCAALRVRELVAVFKDFSAIPHTTTPCDYYVDYTQEATELLTRDPMLEAGAGAAGEAAADAATANVQKKVSSWWSSEVYNELHPRALRTQKQSIIVVGSLLENPVNIAGLCRCGEIFAVESIVVPEKKVFEHPHFVAAARSAELWIPWEEVMPKDLPGYLEGLRRRGYTIVGIEQTANSVSIEAFAFPERCAVVLGAEGQGVPAPLIPLLDVCVEIPQYGLIRSLNVHVTGAIAMYEYTRQHLMGKTQ